MSYLFCSGISEFILIIMGNKWDRKLMEFFFLVLGVAVQDGRLKVYQNVRKDPCNWEDTSYICFLNKGLILRGGNISDAPVIYGWTPSWKLLWIYLALNMFLMLLRWSSGKEFTCQSRRQIWVWSLDLENPLEKEMATHCSILAWRIPWTEEPGGLQSMGSHTVRHDWAHTVFNKREKCFTHRSCCP